MEVESAPSATHLASQSDDKTHVNGSIASLAQDSSTPEPIGSTKTEEIVCIVTRPTEPSGYDVFSLRETIDEQQKSFQLFCHQAADLPQALLEEFLVDEIPEYLRSNGTRRVHVVISTRSGVGLALDFYESVLHRLLKSLGLSPAERSLDNQTTAATEGSTYDLTNFFESVLHRFLKFLALSPAEKLLDIQNQNASEGSVYDLTITQDAQSIRKFAQSLGVQHEGYQEHGQEHTVILLSGDGGVVEMLNGKAPKENVSDTSSSPLIAMLPLGTGNAFFHSSHKPIYASYGTSQPSALVLGLRTLLRGHPAPLPSFKASFSPGSRSISYSNSVDSGHAPTAKDVEERADSVSHLYGAIVASYGFHSQLVWESDTPEYRKHGDKRFGMVASELLKESHAYKATVELTPSDGSGPPRKIERSRHAYVLATMVSNLERAFTISPASQPLDGKLRLVEFGAVGGQKTREIMMQAYLEGKHIGMRWAGEDGSEEGVGYNEVREVRVTSWEEDPRWRKVCIDGDIVELPLGGEMVVRTEEKSHLRVLIDRSLRRG